MIIYASIGLALLIALLLFKPFFGDLDGFVECLKYWIQGNFISMFRGELDEYRWDTLKLWVWVLLSAGCGFSGYYQLPKWVPKLFT
jgi:hypothetical protein